MPIDYMPHPTGPTYHLELNNHSLVVQGPPLFPADYKAPMMFEPVSARTQEHDREFVRRISEQFAIIVSASTLCRR